MVEKEKEEKGYRRLSSPAAALAAADLEARAFCETRRYEEIRMSFNSKNGEGGVGEDWEPLVGEVGRFERGEMTKE